MNPHPHPHPIRPPQPSNLSRPSPRVALSWQVRKVKLAVQKFRTDIYRIALRMRVRAGRGGAGQGGGSRSIAAPLPTNRGCCLAAAGPSAQTQAPHPHPTHHPTTLPRPRCPAALLLAACSTPHAQR